MGAAAGVVPVRLGPPDGEAVGHRRVARGAPQKPLEQGAVLVPDVHLTCPPFMYQPL